MIIYKCASPGCGEYSSDNSQRCILCGQKNWTEANQSEMTDDEWPEVLDFADSEESEFAIAQAWAETGAIPGMMLLGSMYASGSGCEKDESKAFAWWSKAADRKYPEAISYAGAQYIYGAGVQQDITKGLMLWKASGLKEAMAPFLLGMFYDTGSYVKQDQKRL